MPNALLKAQVIVATALGLLQRDIVLPRTVWTDAQGNSPLGADDTFSIKVPGRLTARRRALRGTGAARQVQMDTIAESKVDMKLTEDIYSAVPITDEELTLDISDFGAQILAPQVRAVAEGLEDDLVLLMRSAPYPNSPLQIDPSGTYSGFVDARKALNDENVPFANRFCVIGSGLEAAVLKDPNFHEADKSGSDSALRDAIIGNVAGFTVAVSNALDEDEGYVYHKTAFAMAMRAPAKPDGATFGQSQSYQGLAMRWLKDYDFTTTSDRSLVDTFAGYNYVPDTVNATPSFVRAVKLELASATISMTPGATSVAIGGSRQLQVKDGAGRAVSAGSVQFVSSDPTKVSVNTGGLITGIAAGSATVTATYQGRSATSTVTVTA